MQNVLYLGILVGSCSTWPEPESSRATMTLSFPGMYRQAEVCVFIERSCSRIQRVIRPVA
jgi:hypothetical protein